MIRCLHSGILVVVLSALGCAATSARESTTVSWPDSTLGRTQTLALLQTLNADLLSHDSATLTLERWCGEHHLASPAKVLALRVHDGNKRMPPELRHQLGVRDDEPVKYRHVQLRCGEHVLSNADNWYLPGRLTAAMNQQLDQSDAPFGKVVQPLHFRRHTLSAQLLWSPLPEGWEMRDGPTSKADGVLQIPGDVLQHRAVLRTGDNQPFSVLIETYTGEVLRFKHDIK